MMFVIKYLTVQIKGVQSFFFFSLQHVQEPAKEMESQSKTIGAYPLHICHDRDANSVYFKKHHRMAKT